MAPLPRRRALPLIIGAAALAAVALPGAALAASGGLDQTGGARRNDDSKVQSVRQAIQTGAAKNVILLIGDGMGDSEITVARNYAYGADSRLPGIDALPLTGQYTTFSLYKAGTPYAGKPDYTPDSAATGTGWATGTKSYDGAIGVDIRGAARDNLTEIARANGLKTGNVSTAEIQDATPAVQAAHVTSRSCYGPDTMSTCPTDALENGGRGSISEQLLNTRADVTLGGGSASFTQTAKAGRWQGDTLFTQAADRGFQVVQDADGLDKVKSADANRPVLGLFTPGNFPTRYAPLPQNPVGTTNATPATCTANPARLDQRLSLASLTKKSISLLNTGGKKGFFLQVEGASIDKQDHGADPCGQIGETVDLDEAVKTALDFAKKDGNTLVITTADHAHTSQIVDNPTPGLNYTLLTNDGSPMTVSYNTNKPGSSQQHTGSQVRIAAFGPGAANVVGLTDQTDNFFTISDSLRLDRNLSRFSEGARLESPGGRLRAGERFSVYATGFGGDRQLTGTVQGQNPIPTTDLIGGAAQIDLVAPSKSGDYRIVLTGSQTGKKVTLTFTVR
ncbi:MAG: alkaline phosphatase [Micrococcales bacterium]|nr:alkaline phosphatase [Micrococcales bacterium]